MLALLSGAISSGPSVINTVSGLIGIDNKDDASRRLPANLRAYTAAQQGNADAVMYLRGRSGRFGTVTVTQSWGDGETPGSVGPWATAPARDDAYNKYTAALSGIPLPAELPAEPNAFRQILQGAIDNVRREIAGEVATVGSAIVTGAAQQIAPEGSPEAGTFVVSTNKQQLLLVALAVVVLVLLMRR